MGDAEHLEILKHGSSVWNRWREDNPQAIPKLSHAHLREARLSGANLANADLRLAYFGRADLSGADLTGADLSETSIRGGSFAKARLENAILVGADLRRADLLGARMTGADLSHAYLEGANLTGADLQRAVLVGADLQLAVAVGTDLRRADLTGSKVYGIAAWNVELEGAIQTNLIITPDDQSTITTDNLQVAQFVYLLLDNPSIRDVIETVGKKAILILGRFSAERKPFLDVIRSELRMVGFVPILFDFEGPRNRDVTETVSTLAHLARAVIADISEPRSIPQELMSIIPNLPSVPVQPIIDASSVEYGMFEHFRRYPWVRETVRYSGTKDLLDCLRSALRELTGADP